MISLREAAFFASGDDAVYPGTYSSIEKIAHAIAALPSQVRLEGHTDSVPIHNSRFRSNWELSAARSIAMLELLVIPLRYPAAAPGRGGLCRHGAGGIQRYRAGTRAQPPRGYRHPERIRPRPGTGCHESPLTSARKGRPIRPRLPDAAFESRNRADPP